MKNLLAAAAASFMLATAGMAFADPTGAYDIKGVNPDGSTYTGSVLVTKLGDTFALTYSVSDSDDVAATAIGDDEVLSIGYGDGDDIGVALMVRNGEKWEGVWTYLGAKSLGTEEWHPQ